jgi:hypothetical protein
MRYGAEKALPRAQGQDRHPARPRSIHQPRARQPFPGRTST